VIAQGIASAENEATVAREPGAPHHFGPFQAAWCRCPESVAPSDVAGTNDESGLSGADSFNRPGTIDGLGCHSVALTNHAGIQARTFDEPTLR
jgi:hypothetical protein